jgi:hypothetical protein
LAKAVLAELERRKPCGESFLAHCRGDFCLQHRRTGFPITPLSHLFRPLEYPVRQSQVSSDQTLEFSKSSRRPLLRG